MSAFSYEINRDGIAILTFDLPGEKVNKLTTPVMNELSGILDELSAKKDVKALVFRSNKDESFIVGADIAVEYALDGLLLKYSQIPQM